MAFIDVLSIKDVQRRENEIEQIRELLIEERIEFSKEDLQEITKSLTTLSQLQLIDLCRWLDVLCKTHFNECCLIFSLMLQNSSYAVRCAVIEAIRNI